MRVNLCRVVSALQVRTPLVFPALDAGFKGSAWHGRIDNFVQRDDVLNRALKKAPGSSASDRYWIDAPEDRIDDASGPFGRAVYEVGDKFELALVAAVSHEVLNERLLSRLVAALTDAGRADGAACKGSFEVLTTRAEAYPMSALAPPQGMRDAPGSAPNGRASAQLTIELSTMLRLGDGEHMEAAQRALLEGLQAVPSLAAMAASVLRRLTTLNIFEDVQLMSGLADRVKKLATCGEIGIHHARIAPFDGQRISGHVNQRLPIGGLLGVVSFVGPSALMADIYPLFKLAEWVRIGQKTGLGLGRVRVNIETIRTR